MPGSLSTAAATLAEPGRENVYPGLANQSPEPPGSASAAADEPQMLVGKHPKPVDGNTFALDAEARCECGELVDAHPTMACDRPYVAAADEPGETPCP